jgi:hypothetical protein
MVCWTARRLHRRHPRRRLGLLIQRAFGFGARAFPRRLVTPRLGFAGIADRREVAFDFAAPGRAEANGNLGATRHLGKFLVWCVDRVVVGQAGDDDGFEVGQDFGEQFQVGVLRRRDQHDRGEVEADRDAGHAGGAQLALAAA